MLMIIILVLSFIVYIFNIKHAPHLINKKTSIWCGIALFVHGALRHPSVGIDVYGYVNSYKLVQRLSFEQIFTSTKYTVSRDPYFYAFLKLLTFINEDPQFMLVVISAITAICFSVFIYKNSKSVLLSFVMFVGLRFYSFTLTGLRQAIALGITMLSYEYIKNNKFFKFFICVWVASLFHSSAWIFLLAYPISKIKNIRTVVFTLLLLMAANLLTGNGIIGLLLKTPMMGQYQTYASGETTESGFTILLIYYAIIFMAYIYKKLNADEKDYNTVIYNFSIIGTVITSMTFNFATIFRMGYYYVLSIILLLPLAISYESNKYIKYAITTVTIVLLVAQYIIIGSGAGTGNYKFFWE